MQDKARIDELAAARANGAASLQIAWRGALESLPDLPPETLALLAGALPSPDCTRHLARFLGREQHPRRAVDSFLAEVDDSEESLAEWLAAFDVLACFLESTPHRPTLSQACGYLHCCAAVAHTGARYTTFPMTVETMLETYGYSGEGA